MMMKVPVVILMVAFGALGAQNLDTKDSKCLYPGLCEPSSVQKKSVAKEATNIKSNDENLLKGSNLCKGLGICSLSGNQPSSAASKSRTNRQAKEGQGRATKSTAEDSKCILFGNCALSTYQQNNIVEFENRNGFEEDKFIYNFENAPHLCGEFGICGLSSYHQNDLRNKGRRFKREAKVEKAQNQDNTIASRCMEFGTCGLSTFQQGVIANPVKEAPIPAIGLPTGDNFISFANRDGVDEEQTSAAAAAQAQCVLYGLCGLSSYQQANLIAAAAAEAVQEQSTVASQAVNAAVAAIVSNPSKSPGEALENAAIAATEVITKNRINQSILDIFVKPTTERSTPEQVNCNTENTSTTGHPENVVSTNGGLGER